MNSMQITTPLSRKAVLVSVNISQWTARKLDRKVTDETNRKYHAADDAGRYNKLLIASEHLAELTGMVSKARMLHYKMTQPWADDGPRILPNALFSKFSDEFRTLKREFNDAADRFCAAYPAFVEERKKALNGLFNDGDYPSADDIRSKFNLDLTILPFPDAADFRSELDDDTVAEIRAQLQVTTSTVVDKAMAHTVERIVSVVGHMANKLTAYSNRAPGELGGVFRDSLVENVRELADLLPAFNLVGDAKLDEIAKRIKAELCTEDAKSLRENDGAREAVQKSADEIVAAVSGLFG
jgi:hypothetical protein